MEISNEGDLYMTTSGLESILIGGIIVAFAIAVISIFSEAIKDIFK